jgi:hypothetical protein
MIPEICVANFAYLIQLEEGKNCKMAGELEKFGSIVPSLTHEAEALMRSC